MASLAAFSAVSSPVADAAAKGDKAAVRALIQQKADVNVAQSDGATALQWAAYRNDLETADLLLAAGANPKTPNRDGFSPLRSSPASHQWKRSHDRKAVEGRARDANERDPNPGDRPSAVPPPAAAMPTRSMPWLPPKPT